MSSIRWKVWKEYHISVELRKKESRNVPIRRTNTIREILSVISSLRKKPKIGKLLVATTRKKVILGTLQFATGQNVPLRFPEWQGTSTLIGPLWDAAGIKMSRTKLSELINEAASIGRGLLSSRLKHKIISLKIDSASRKGRSVFGINLQYATEEGEVKIAHLGKYSTVKPCIYFYIY